MVCYDDSCDTDLGDVRDDVSFDNEFKEEPVDQDDADAVNDGPAEDAQSKPDSDGDEPSECRARNKYLLLRRMAKSKQSLQECFLKVSGRLSPTGPCPVVDKLKVHSNSMQHRWT